MLTPHTPYQPKGTMNTTTIHITEDEVERDPYPSSSRLKWYRVNVSFDNKYYEYDYIFDLDTALDLANNIKANLNHEYLRTTLKNYPTT